METNSIITDSQIMTVFDRYPGIDTNFTIAYRTPYGSVCYIESNSGVSVTIDKNTNSFSLSANIPNTIFTLNCTNCSPFYEDVPKYDQFNKMFSRFRNHYLSIVQNHL